MVLSRGNERVVHYRMRELQIHITTIGNICKYHIPKFYKQSCDKNREKTNIIVQIPFYFSSFYKVQKQPKGQAQPQWQPPN